MCTIDLAIIFVIKLVQSKVSSFKNLKKRKKKDFHTLTKSEILFLNFKECKIDFEKQQKELPKNEVLCESQSVILAFF